ncbi:MAG: hypothetical protein KDJ75_03965 [Alphaproteobacteria bacterium]|nr:hypothetical protein [Alphaproteobacteria bacterium]
MSKKLKIFTPLLYLKLENKSLSAHTWGFPLVLALFISVIALLLPENVNVYGDNGLIRSINQLLSILVAFYIASLAAIATFKSDILDGKFSGEPMKLTVKRSGKKETEELNRRKFLCLLFAYCAFVAMTVFCIGELAVLLKGNVGAVITKAWVLEAAKFAFMFFYAFAISNLLSTTLLGLHYLADRIHRP